MFQRILVANDGSDGALKAFDAAVELAAALNASLHMISVREDLPKYAETIGEIEEEAEGARTYFQSLVQHAARRSALKGVALESTIVSGHEAKAIVDFARAGRYDLLVVGYVGHSKLYEHLWGGTSQNIARLAPCPVLVVK